MVSKFSVRMFLGLLSIYNSYIIVYPICCIYVYIYIYILYTCFQYIILQSSISYLIYKSIDPFKAEKQNCQVPKKVSLQVSVQPAILRQPFWTTPGCECPQWWSPRVRAPGDPGVPRAPAVEDFWSGYGSISGMNIHLPAILGFTRYQGFELTCTKSWWTWMRTGGN